MSTIIIQKTGITNLDTDCIVNAANAQLAAGGGVCGAIFNDAGYYKLVKACNTIGGCPTGNAVLTPGFDLKAKYIIHAVGPIWHGGNANEMENLYSAYWNSLKLVKDNGCHSVGFPLISAGIYGYPADQAWEIAIQACKQFFGLNKEYEIIVIFAVISDEMYKMGNDVLHKLESTTTVPNNNIR